MLSWLTNLFKRWLGWLFGGVSLSGLASDPQAFIASLDPAGVIVRTLISVVVVVLFVELLKLLFGKGLKWLFSSKSKDSKDKRK